MVLSRSTSASARSSSPRVGSSPLIQSTKCWVGRTLRAERLSSFMVVSSTSKRRPLWVLAAGFTNASRAEPPTTELGSENSGRPALPGEWRRRRPGGVASVGASRQEPFGLHSPGKAQLPQNPGATQERPEATTLGATGGRPAPLVRLEATGGRSAPLVRLETTGGRSALPGEWRRRRPGGVASVGACRQEPFGLHSPGKAQLPQNPGATQERPEATTLGATGGRPALLVRLETTGGRSALPGEWRRRRPGGVASVGACRQEPFGLHSPGKAQLPQKPSAPPTKPSATQEPRRLRQRVGDRLCRANGAAGA